MSVYFITAREIGMVKIGYARDPFVRMKTLQVAFPMDLAVEALFKGAGKREKELHKQFAEHRVRGEWFRICPEIEELIASVERPCKPRSEAQRRRLRELHGDPEPFGPHLPPKHILEAWEERRKPRKPLEVPPSFYGHFLTKEEKRRIASGDIHFPFRTKEAA